ncbi:hypothetical protein KI688_001822 [Linnemannia hyalina]|uniref:Uncharacterized protein n=1 Tax=Linnemannia hyalina TaxID=64524 RepID=A0A9P7XTB0_9FUNG|nr:hypothetical protein KI688_001822 [Linnemannia hyalina]
MSNIKRTLSNDQSFQAHPKDSTENFNYNSNASNESINTWSPFKKHVAWALDAIAKKEEVTMPTFAAKFEYHMEGGGERVAKKLILDETDDLARSPTTLGREHRQSSPPGPSASSGLPIQAAPSPFEPGVGAEQPGPSAPLSGAARNEEDLMEVQSYWEHHRVLIGADLMAYRDRAVAENGAVKESHEKLAVNFVFLIEADYQTGGLQVEVEDETWEALCDAIKDLVPPLMNEDIIEIHQWARRLAQNKQGAFERLLEDLPPRNRCLKSILTEMPSIDFYTMHLRAEATYVMNRFATAFIAPEALNVSPLVQLMEAFEHAKSKVEWTVEQIRKVKVRPSANPLVPLWWLRPSFPKPVRCRVDDSD